MLTKTLLLFGVSFMIALAPLNSATSATLTSAPTERQAQQSASKQKREERKSARQQKRSPVLPAIALSLGILAVGIFFLSGLAGIVIGGLAVLVGGIVLTRRNAYSKKDRLMAKIGVLLGGLYLALGFLIVLALLKVFEIELEVFEVLFEHVLG